MENNEISTEIPSADVDEVDGVIPSCLRRNEEEQDKIAEYQQRFNEEVVITKTGKFDEYYSMDYPHKGLLLIFAHSYFTVANLLKRNAEMDVRSMQEAFSRLDFEITIYRDKTLKEIRRIVQKVTSRDLENYASVVVAISSHGGYQEIFARDAPYDPEIEFYKPFKSTKTLSGKPKIFFLGTCRGKNVDPGVTLLGPVQTDSGFLEEYRIPKEADVLLVYATVQGYIAYSNEKFGTHFFKYLSEALNEYADRDLLNILVIANNKIAMNFASQSSINDEWDDNKQCISFMSTLTRIVKFNR